MPRLTMQLPPDLSRRVIRLVDRKRLAYGWSRAQLADKANARVTGAQPFSTNLLDVWCSKARLGTSQRIDLEKALVLLSVFGFGSNELDELVAQLDNAVENLITEATA